jgi:hypothetical protein
LLDGYHLAVRYVEADVDVTVRAFADELSLDPFDRGDCPCVGRTSVRALGAVGEGLTYALPCRR